MSERTWQTNGNPAATAARLSWPLRMVLRHEQGAVGKFTVLECEHVVAYKRKLSAAKVVRCRQCVEPTSIKELLERRLRNARAL